MTSFARSVTRITATAAVTAGAALALGTGTAAADEWPVQQPNSPVSVFEAEGFLTPTDLDYWNPLNTGYRLTSPYGNSTRIVCTAFHGVIMECYQADQDGNPHKLARLPFNFPNITGSSQPGGGPSHFVYPGYLPGIS
ncbi:Uncharacterised protein [Nocardia otitidiscaviarum]|uniref:Secreted protein n=1 Tax=Nocardia otitidiscaviarum TaxID=1823 RepID=A0A379JKQ9_9NOCA|nr:hypothetical protein [Nocardia otitidiscaviarum]MBF6180425.1 hypothetical protein [Nocardia otitidiscaviarum]SUD48811.1 Uncharacterised protein [Nocardia otitidiscaviarum]